METFLKLVDQSSRTLEGIAVVLLYGFGGLMLAEVFARGFLSQSLPFSWEYSAFAMASVFMLASGRAIRTATHVRVSLILEATPARISRLLDLAANFAALVIVAFIIAALYNAFSTSLERGLVSPTIVRTPLAIPQAFVLIGSIQFWFDLLARLIRLLKGMEFEERGADAPAKEPLDV
ncbi:MAG: TRAP transporter small permease [Hyphomicrobiales bacterium]